MIELREVYKIYRRGSVPFEAVSGVNLSIDKGDFAVITGPSGSGKSTLMTLIGCLDTPTKGNVRIDGRDISQLSRDGLSRIRNQKIGFIFQQFNLVPTLNALDNVALPIEIAGKSREFAVKQAKDLLVKVGLSDKLYNYPNELSGGQMQRVAVGRALSNDPEVILADEPTGNLDSKSGADVLNLLLVLNRQGKTIVLITHDEKIARHGNRHFLLSDGKVVKSGIKKGGVKK